ncbi:MAG: hypothetical protein U1D00_33580 [Mycobacterium sp.]|nr:hypothetical protein [Mycobacterium sp.]
MPFNPPPNWPDFPPGWSPDTEWRPDPSWPPAPPGWQFWTSDEKPSDPARRRTSGHLPGAISFVAVIAVGGIALATWEHLTAEEPSPAPPPQTDETLVAPTFVPRHSDVPEQVDPGDFSSWQPFGGIEADVSPAGRVVVLDTHDTTDTWTTKWSGIALRDNTTCSMSMSGRVRDISHRRAVPGGYGIGIAWVDGTAGREVLTGAAVQYDFGRQGYRLTTYPEDSDTALIEAPVDNDWHSFTVDIDSTGTAIFQLDGVPVVNDKLESSCGRPVIRVWAGAVEFADIAVELRPT